MADISNWKYLLPRPQGQFLIINLSPAEYQVLLPDVAACQTLWIDRPETRESRQHRAATPVALADGQLPFADRMFDGVLARLKGPQTINLISEIHRVLRPLGLLFCLIENASIKEAALTRRLNALNVEYRSYIGMPSVNNPWYILPADDPAVSRYFFLNLLTSRHRTRRLAIGLVRRMAQWDRQYLLLRGISHRVVIGRKGAPG